MTECEGFDSHAGQRWIYPNNLPVRTYQKQAVEKALFHNAMIVLPTGFGKTFIAAVVMYNFYRWYPMGKIVFVAPTRPLVAQQIAECRKISGIPSSDCVEITGITSSAKRTVFWETKRVFFATPQVIENDLQSCIAPAKSIKCIVIDEAHRAQGGYAYVNIIQDLHRQNENGFRILALSATPGSDINRVISVMQNLLISEVMFRTENSLDLMSFKNEKVSKAWTVELTGRHKNFVDRFIKICDPAFQELHRAGLTWSGRSIDKVAKFTLLKALQQLDTTAEGKTKGRLKLVCSAAMSLSVQFEMLTIYGLRVFYESITRAMNEPRKSIKVVLSNNPDFDKMLGEIRDMFDEDITPDISRHATRDLTKGHPKLTVVKELLMKHFGDSESDGFDEETGESSESSQKKSTRAIVFSKYRESVYDIVQTLYSAPGIKPAAFVGQGAGKKGAGGMKQRDQIQMVQDFKAGKYNVLVATCVAEEGLDIGEVDLIICFDATGSVISNVQRRGRTGRKRAGGVQTLLTKGFEEKKLQKAGDSRRSIEDQLYKRENYMPHRYHHAPRMVPASVFPVCLEQRVVPINDEPEVEEKTPKRGRQKKEASISPDECDIKKRKRKKKDGFESDLNDSISKDEPDGTETKNDLDEKAARRAKKISLFGFDSEDDEWETIG